MEQSLGAVRHAYLALERGDLLTFLAALHEQVEWHFPLYETPVVHSGQVAILQHVLDRRSGRRRSYAPDRFLDGPGHVLALGASFAHLWLFEGGQATQIHAFEDTSRPKNWGRSLGPRPDWPTKLAADLTNEGASWVPER